MPRYLRYQPEPHTLVFVTDRCFQGRFLLRPSPSINATIVGVLARALERFDVRLYGHCFMSNHYHLLLSAGSAAHLSGFMQYFKGNLARKLGRAHDWPGKFWEHRYHSSPVMDDNAAIERMKYIFSNAVKENLVARVSEYPGVHCHHELVDGRTLRGHWEDWSARCLTGKTKAVRYTLRCSALPSLAGLSEPQWRAVMRALSSEVHSGLAPQRRVLGEKKIRSAHPHSVPKALQRRPQPLCHSTRTEIKRAFRAAYRAFVAAYREAFALFEEGVLGAAFPPGGLPPVGWWLSLRDGGG